MPISQIVTNSIANGAIIAADIASGQTLSLNGITFPATQVPSGDANTLDDYEEGTWTPIDGSGAGLGLTVITSARYVKIGKLVNVNFFLNYPSNSSGLANKINGLPFTLQANQYGTGAVFNPTGQTLTVYYDSNSDNSGFQMRTNTNTTPANSVFSGVFVCVNFTYVSAN